ncbi:IclR family transcriptional regulator [Phytohabitans kaempferiae]|uniref:IclR family transcriptional regulator n=1 Tax=Phytohabitans kaempferiae TaxID=1620943 RepID=A0ABV6M1P8_9ACTN
MPEESDKGRTIARAAQILDSLARNSGGAELGDIAARAQMSPSGAHRALRALIDVGLATQDGARGRYRLGPRILVFAQGMNGENALLASAESELDTLNRDSGETVVLTVLRDGKMWNIASREGTGDLISRGNLGGEPHFHASARGLLFLAHMPRPEARALIRSTGLPALTPHTITNEEELWTAVDEARRRHLAWSRDTSVMGSSGVAAPIIDPDGSIVACVAVHLPSANLTPDTCKRLEQQIASAARQIEQRSAQARTWPGHTNRSNDPTPEGQP